MEGRYGAVGDAAVDSLAALASFWSEGVDIQTRPCVLLAKNIHFSICYVSFVVFVSCYAALVGCPLRRRLPRHLSPS